MTDKNAIPKAISDHALEMIMRDVLDGVMDLSLQSAFSESAPEFEIIEISSASKSAVRPKHEPLTEDADILYFPDLKQVI